MLFDNKKAQIGSTATWIAASFIILFILAIFLISVLVLSSEKKITSRDFGVVFSGESNKDLTIMKNVLSLLESEISVDGENKRVKDFLFLYKSWTDETRQKKHDKILNAVQPVLNLLESCQGSNKFVGYSIYVTDEKNFNEKKLSSFDSAYKFSPVHFQDHFVETMSKETVFISSLISDKDVVYLAILKNQRGSGILNKDDLANIRGCADER